MYNSDNEKESYNKFSNKAYSNLIWLVIKNKLNNIIGNKIISFFNKYLNLFINFCQKIFNKSVFL